MEPSKAEKKDLKPDGPDVPENDSSLDGKGLHDLYRHATKLIK